MLWVPSGSNAFNWSVGSHQTTRPAAAFGTSVTPGNNTKGSWVSLLAGTSVTQDVFGLLINVNSGNKSAAAKDMLVDIGVDPSGGTSYTVLAPDLITSCAAPYNIGNGGVWYYFPIWIRAGSRIGARASVNNATVGTVRVNVTCFGQPRNRQLIKVGTRIEAIGVTGASSSGTAVTSGTTTEGSWTSLGTLTNPAWWFQVGMGVNDTTMAALAYHLDVAIGDASNKDIVIENSLITTTTGEQLNNMPNVADVGKYAPAGTNVYGRMQCSGTPDSNLSMVAYALGG